MRTHSLDDLFQDGVVVAAEGRVTGQLQDVKTAIVQGFRVCARF